MPKLTLRYPFVKLAVFENVEGLAFAFAFAVAAFYEPAMQSMPEMTSKIVASVMSWWKCHLTQATGGFP